MPLGSFSAAEVWSIEVKGSKYEGFPLALLSRDKAWPERDRDALLITVLMSDRDVSTLPPRLTIRLNGLRPPSYLAWEEAGWDVVSAAVSEA